MPHLAMLAALSAARVALPHPWPHGESPTVAERFLPPRGFSRPDLPPNSFGAWLRRLPVRTGAPLVLLHDGQKKRNQAAHAAILDIDVGERDLQQCADAVIRLRAEYLRAEARDEEICFRFTSGHAWRWLDFREGVRPRVRGRAVSFIRTEDRDESYASFRRYLDVAFTYSGSLSLAAELEPIRDPEDVAPGDVFIQGGSPGHAVIVLDVVERDRERRFLLAQSFMPAQDIHVLKNPERASPWYHADGRDPVETPEWTFRWRDLARFRARGCP